MVYFVFDLDETLGNFDPVFLFLCDLKPETTIKNWRTIPDSLQEPLNSAYKFFVESIAQEEVSGQPLGIFRPGIFGIMQRLQQINAKVVIYSNNGHLSNLEFARNVIHTYLGVSDLICDCIDWHREGREEEHTQPINIGAARKTWSVLSKLLKEGPCQAEDTLEPEDVFFFDDLDHRDLQATLGPRYIKVPGYSFTPSYDRIAEIYSRAIHQSGILENQTLRKEYFKYVQFKKSKNIVLDEFVLYMIQLSTEQKKKGNRTNSPPESDQGIYDMIKAIETYEQKQQGGSKYSKIGSKKQRKRRKGKTRGRSRR